MQVRLLAALLGTLALLLAAPAAQAAPTWIDGNAKYTYAPNCASIIFGSPYYEAEAGTYASFYADPNNLPDAGEIFYIRMVAAGIGAPCGGAYANFEMILHPQMRYAVSPEFPILCYGYREKTGQWQRETAACPTSPGPVGRFGNRFAPRNTNTPAWPLPQGNFWQIQVPVYAKRRLVGASGSSSTGLFCGDCFVAPTQIIDGNGSPWTDPWQWVNVQRAEPAAGFPNPFYAFPAANKVETTAYEFNYYEPGQVTALLTEDTNGNGNPDTGEPNGATATVPVDSDDYALEMRHVWSNLKPNTKYLYELGIQLARDGLFYASAPRGFTTPSSWPAPAVAFGVESGGGTPTGTPPPRSKTLPPPTQPGAPSNPFSKFNLEALKRNARAQRLLARISPPKRIKRRRLLKKKRVIIKFRCARACTVKSKLKLGKKKRVIAKGSKKLKKAGKGKLKLKLTKKGRRILKKTKKGKLRLDSTTKLKGFPVFKSRQKLKLVK